jgi:hypothetical protein
MTLAAVVADDDVNCVGAGEWVDAGGECHPINKKKETTNLIVGVFVPRITKQ